MPSYTAQQVSEATNNKLVAYYNGVSLGVLTEGDHAWRIITNDSQVGSSLTGSNGFIVQTSGGEHAEIELTLRNVNKNVIYNVLKNKMAEVATTSISSPYAGKLEARTDPKVETPYPLVLYVLPGNVASPVADNTSDNAHVFPKAIYTGDFEFMLNSDTVTDITLTFIGMVDVANNNRCHYWGSGVSANGTIA